MSASFSLSTHLSLKTRLPGRGPALDSPEIPLPKEGVLKEGRLTSLKGSWPGTNWSHQNLCSGLHSDTPIMMMMINKSDWNHQRYIYIPKIWPPPSLSTCTALKKFPSDAPRRLRVMAAAPLTIGVAIEVPFSGPYVWAMTGKGTDKAFWAELVIQSDRFDSITTTWSVGQLTPCRCIGIFGAVNLNGRSADVDVDVPPVGKGGLNGGKGMVKGR